MNPGIMVDLNHVMYHVLLTPLKVPLRLLPDALHTEVLARVFNHLLRGQAIAARLGELEGKTICLDITDAPCRLHFRIQNGRLRPSGAGRADVSIRGTLADFLDLAARREDPDTLFFHRRLCIEGDTETGLHVKNLLDALDYDIEAHVRAVLVAPLADLALGIIRRLPLPGLQPSRPR